MLTDDQNGGFEYDLHILGDPRGFLNACYWGA